MSGGSGGYNPYEKNLNYNLKKTILLYGATGLALFGLIKLDTCGVQKTTEATHKMQPNTPKVPTLQIK